MKDFFVVYEETGQKNPRHSAGILLLPPGGGSGAIRATPPRLPAAGGSVPAG